MTWLETAPIGLVLFEGETALLTFTPCGNVFFTIVSAVGAEVRQSFLTRNV